MSVRPGEDAELDRAVAEASKLIRQTFKDAEAHARNVLTEALRSTGEGRATAAKVRRSRSYQAAEAKLDGLLDALTAVIGGFRDETYTAEYLHWSHYLPRRVLRVAPGSPPPFRFLDRARAALVHGRTIRQTLAPRIELAKKALGPALTVAGNRATPRRDGHDRIRQWSHGSASAVEAVTRSALVDGQTMAHRLAGRDVIRPELLHPDPSLPEPLS